ncbi:MAG: hypothetical protein HFI33_05545 [Lachnospiraceae bacterium]|nr:hypothetical protein [Lachnospiraceae bacterium]
MSKKTNKTSHVLNLLTNSPATEEGDTPVSGQEKKSDIQSHTVSPAKVTVVDEGSRNDRVSQEILTKLSEELETAAPATESAEPAEAAVEPVQPAEPEVQVPPQEAVPVQPAMRTVEPPAQAQPAPEQISMKSSSRLGEQLQDDDFHFINVMEELIMQHDLDNILKQYNVCTCNRCKADVCALTLTRLPAKYVVAGKNSLSPILNYYKSRYRVGILAELSKACGTVREHPHHKR